MTADRPRHQDTAALGHLQAAFRVLTGDRPEAFVWHLGPASVKHASTARPLAVLAPVPSARDPRVLLPLDAPAAGLKAAIACHARSAASPAARMAARGLMVITSLGLAGRVLRRRLTVSAVNDAMAEMPLRTFTNDVLGRKDTCLALRLAPGRPNAKPVVQVSSHDGTPLAFAKFGWEPLTKRLIRQEARMLTALAEPLRGSVIDIPRVLFSGTWQGFETVIVSPLAGPGRMPRRPADVPADALRTLADVCAEPAPVPLEETVYWQRMHARAEVLAPMLPRSAGDAVHAALSRLQREHGPTPLRLGLKHGDWIPPNMIVGPGGRLTLWDWEHAAFGAPLGTDIMQFILFQALRRRAPGPGLSEMLKQIGGNFLERQRIPADRSSLLACLSLLETLLWFAEAAGEGRCPDHEPQFEHALRWIADEL